MTFNSDIRLSSVDGLAPETVKPGVGEEPEIDVLEDQAADDASPISGQRFGRGGSF